MVVETFSARTTRTRNVTRVCSVEVQWTQETKEIFLVNGVCEVIIVKEKE